jgi:hypothetical protein
MLGFPDLAKFYRAQTRPGGHIIALLSRAAFAIASADAVLAVLFKRKINRMAINPRA